MRVDMFLEVCVEMRVACVLAWARPMPPPAATGIDTDAGMWFGMFAAMVRHAYRHGWTCVQTYVWSCVTFT